MSLAAVTAPATTQTFMVPRTSATLIGEDPNHKLVSTIDLSQANCHGSGIVEQDKCNGGKYMVRQVTAHPWFNSGYPDGQDGTGASAVRTDFTFVGK